MPAMPNIDDYEEMPAVPATDLFVLLSPGEVDGQVEVTYTACADEVLGPEIIEGLSNRINGTFSCDVSSGNAVEALAERIIDGISHYALVAETCVVVSLGTRPRSLVERLLGRISKKVDVDSTLTGRLNDALVARSTGRRESCQVPLNA